MQQKPSKRRFNIEVEYPNGLSRLVKVKAASREAAERRALKFHPAAIGVKRESA